MDLKEVISKNIREIRVQKGLTQVQLAKAAGLSVTYLSTVENGSINITVDILEGLAKALDVRVEKLVAGIVREKNSTLPAEVQRDLEAAVRLIQKNLARTPPKKRGRPRKT